MKLEDLYSKKGELITTIEVAQAKLQSVNEEIVKVINAANSDASQVINGKQLEATA